MATSYDVNLKIGSAIGYNVVGRGLIFGLTPIQTTTLTLNGEVFPPSGYNTGTRTLSVAPLTDFILTPGTTSTRQLVQMTNNGNAILTITDILYSLNENIAPWFYFNTATSTSTSTITILPSSTATFELAYIATEADEYNNYFILVSNDDSGYYKVYTRQLAFNTANFSISPSGFNTTTNKIGYNNAFTYNITPIVNLVEQPELVIPVTGSISGSPAWSILGTDINSISVNFNPNEVNNVNGTYVSTLTVTSNSVSKNVINTATINIDYDKNKHLSSWLSPASHYNSIIGVSYDLIEDVRYLTIGVGMGGDGVPIYGNGGSVYANTSNLGLGAETVATPYPFWANVYRIPFTGAAQTYTSNDYIVKTTDGIDYSGYFGEYGEPGSMFIVEDDGYGSLTIELNHLRELSGDTETDATLQNLTRAFHYYSGVDVDGRYEPLPPEYTSTIDDVTTYLFVGFNYNTRDKLASVNTSIVDIPV